jgi:hypothetical protein
MQANAAAVEVTSVGGHHVGEPSGVLPGHLLADLDV